MYAPAPSLHAHMRSYDSADNEVHKYTASDLRSMASPESAKDSMYTTSEYIVPYQPHAHHYAAGKMTTLGPSHSSAVVNTKPSYSKERSTLQNEDFEQENLKAHHFNAYQGPARYATAPAAQSSQTYEAVQHPAPLRVAVPAPYQHQQSQQVPPGLPERSSSTSAVAELTNSNHTYFRHQPAVNDAVAVPIPVRRGSCDSIVTADKSTSSHKGSRKASRHSRQSSAVFSHEVATHEPRTKRPASPKEVWSVSNSHDNTNTPSPHCNDATAQSPTPPDSYVGGSALLMSADALPTSLNGYVYEADSHTGLTPYRQAIVSVVGCVLQQLFGNGSNDQLPEDASLISVFHTSVPPAITIASYSERIAKYTDCSVEVLIMAVVHINRILQTRPQMQINSLNIHRLLLTSVMCSAKFFDDNYFNNAYYAKVGGVTTRELNWLEVEFLALINFDLLISAKMYRQFYTELTTPALHADGMCIKQCQSTVMPPLPDAEMAKININKHEWLHYCQNYTHLAPAAQPKCIRHTAQQYDAIESIQA